MYLPIVQNTYVLLWRGNKIHDFGGNLYLCFYGFDMLKIINEFYKTIFSLRNLN